MSNILTTKLSTSYQLRGSGLPGMIASSVVLIELKPDSRKNMESGKNNGDKK